MIIGLVSDFLPECKSKISFGLYIHHAGTFGVKDLSMFLKFMFADSRTGKVRFAENMLNMSLGSFQNARSSICRVITFYIIFKHFSAS